MKKKDRKLIVYFSYLLPLPLLAVVLLSILFFDSFDVVAQVLPLFFCMNTTLFPCLLCINGEFSYILHVIYDSEIVFKCHKLCLKSEYTRILCARIYYFLCTRFINFCQTLSDITM